MQKSKQHFINAQRGVSLSGLIVVLALLGVIAVFALKVLPTFIEYRAIKNSIASAKIRGGTVLEMRQSFDRSADINTVESIKGRDLVFSNANGEPEISFEYEKRIPLATNVSLVIDYSGTTARDGVVVQKTDTAAK